VLFISLGVTAFIVFRYILYSISSSLGTSGLPVQNALPAMLLKQEENNNSNAYETVFLK
jgi:hypothetical protein